MMGVDIYCVCCSGILVALFDDDVGWVMAFSWVNNVKNY